MAEANVNMKVEETTTESFYRTTCRTTSTSTHKTGKSLQIPVNTENDALNMLVAFLQVAQKRGAFSLEEAYKIMESVNVFQKNVPQQPATEQLPTVEEEK